MRIAVCMKQVPAYSEGNMDPKDRGVDSQWVRSCSQCL